MTRSRTGDTYCSYSPCDPGEFWAVGAGGIALRWAGEQWQPVDTGTTRDLWAVLSNEFGDVYAVGDVGTIIRWNGGEFEQVQSDTGANLRAGHLLSNRHLYVLADTGEVRFFDGQWHSIHQTGPLRAMGQHDDAGASAVGDDGRWVACRRDACTERFLDGGPLLRGVAGDEFRTWAVGDSTIVSLEDLLTWEPRAGQFNAVCATSRGVSNSGNSFRQSDVWTVGNNGAVAHFTATGGASSSGSGEFFTAWAPESGGASSLVGVACSAQDVWAVGAGGLLMRLHIPFALAE